MKKYSFAKLYDAAVAVALGIVALIVYYSTMADYSFPGDRSASGAHLEVLWKGLDSASGRVCPLMESVTKFFGIGNGTAVLYGALAVVLMYVFVTLFLRICLDPEKPQELNHLYSRIGGSVAAVVFMLTPAVHEAATHLEPRMFAFVWAMLTALAIFPFAMMPKKLNWLVMAVVGWMCAAGLCDSPIFIALLPLYIMLLFAVAKAGNVRPWAGLTAFILVFLVAFCIRAARIAPEFVPFLRETKAAFAAYFAPDGWLFVMCFATIPFLVALAASGRSLREYGSLPQWIAHAALTFITIIAVATPLSPSSQMAKYAILPVAPCAFAAFVAGYLAIYWLNTMQPSTARTLTPAKATLVKFSRAVAMPMIALLAIVLLISTALHVCAFDSSRGEFADRLADKVLDDMGARKWLVTDGTLDDHILLAADRRGAEIHLVSLVREKDDAYLKKLAKEIKAARLGGDSNEDLLIWLDTLGILTFVQHWFEAAPDEIKANVAVWGYPDLSPKIECKPEFMFFAAGDGRDVDWQKEWSEVEQILHAPEGWGSYKLWEEKNPTDRARYNLRRHLGLLATDYGVMMQDRGDPSKAFAMYELVLNKIDSDNICALINELDLAAIGLKEAKAKQRHLQARIEAIVKDTKRRYDPRLLRTYYGQVRNPQMFGTIGLALARSGHSGEALKNLSRAMQLMNPDNRTAIINTMASIYADSSDLEKSRELYESVLEKDPDNHDALFGMMRIALLQGDNAKAVKYLELVDNISGDDPRANTERAMLAMLKGQIDKAKDLLMKATDNDPTNLRVWNFLANVVAQQFDSAQNERQRTAFLKELEEIILPAMEKQATNPSDYFVQTVRAMVLIRKGDSIENRKDARDALVAAASHNPAAADAGRTSDMILSLDISMNDTEDAARQAQNILRRNPKSPLANYVMGSLALQKGDYIQAEAFLRRSADAPKPVSLAMNDLAEVLRRSGRMDEAEKYARRAVEATPALYVAWETLGSILLANGGNLDEAEKCAKKACELSIAQDGKETDVRMLVTLARVQMAKGDTLRAKGTIRKVMSRIDELSDFERNEFEEFRKNGK